MVADLEQAKNTQESEVGDTGSPQDAEANRNEQSMLWNSMKKEAQEKNKVLSGARRKLALLFPQLALKDKDREYSKHAKFEFLDDDGKQIKRKTTKVGKLQNFLTDNWNQEFAFLAEDGFSHK